MKIWQYIHKKLKQNQSIILLYVLDSQGSSPGRQGFKMVVAEDGEIKGTIGGGIMEHKLVEQARTRLKNKEIEIRLKPQYHDKHHYKDRSGMICSGNQYVASIPFTPVDKNKLRKILSVFQNNKNCCIQFTPEGWELIENLTFLVDHNKVFEYIDDSDWAYTEKLILPPVLHIFGGGHVGLALSEVMSLLGFYIKIYDDRSELNTLEQNRFADEKHLVNYKKLKKDFQHEPGDYVAIMTFGYRMDKVILKQLIDKKIAYLGMMGSEAKVEQIIGELEAEGIEKEKLSKIKSPIGINIYSKTTMEIAISVAAEIIKEKNKHLPTGRTKTKST